MFGSHFFEFNYMYNTKNTKAEPVCVQFLKFIFFVLKNKGNKESTKTWSQFFFVLKNMENTKNT